MSEYVLVVIKGDEKGNKKLGAQLLLRPSQMEKKTGLNLETGTIPTFLTETP